MRTIQVQCTCQVSSWILATVQSFYIFIILLLVSCSLVRNLIGVERRVLHDAFFTSLWITDWFARTSSLVKRQKDSSDTVNKDTDQKISLVKLVEKFLIYRNWCFLSKTKLLFLQSFCFDKIPGLSCAFSHSLIFFV